MLPKEIFLLSGYSGSGKDFFYKNRENLSEFFVIHSNEEEPFWFKNSFFLRPFKRYAFADFLKEICKVPTNRRITPEERKLIISVANEIKKNDGENFFVDHLIEKIFEEKAEFVMITDLRFPNELQRIKEVFAGKSKLTILKINGFRLGEISHKRIFLNNEDQKAETSSDSFPYDYLVYRS